MPRSRGRKMIESTEGPEHSVAVDTEPKIVEYSTVKFRNVHDIGTTLEFSFNGRHYNLPDNCEVDLRKEVVEHLSSRVVRTWKTRTDANGNKEKYPVDSPRFVLQVLKTYTVEE